MTLRRFDELTREALRERTGDLVVVPLGATEQHGEHLPVMTDAAIITHLAERAGEIAGERIDVLIAPTVRVGISGHHVPFGGTLTVGSETFIRVLVDLVSALRTQGFSRSLFVNGHGGNDAAMRVAVERLAVTATGGESTAALSYWAFAGDAVGHRFPTPGHAGGFETSAMLALRPELVGAVPTGPLVQFDLATDVVTGLHDVRPEAWRSSAGVTDNAAGADAKAGAADLEQIASRIADAMVEQVARLDAARRTGESR
ncbi:creatininase family protein [Salinibacterium soli]|uniref:Creatininase family protein n=1 Tax=Antiquaquibacter soli TaxID=3064523 RepID=A0ABT9BJG6_9MICO|nr:creatininase family protein [Protaetiibacter sp. WY-16]MDO7881161.1 creatininase family protein [Protaetiibacter sp. WY-16]